MKIDLLPLRRTLTIDQFIQKYHPFSLHIDKSSLSILLPNDAKSIRIYMFLQLSRTVCWFDGGMQFGLMPIITNVGNLQSTTLAYLTKLSSVTPHVTCFETGILLQVTLRIPLN